MLSSVGPGTSKWKYLAAAVEFTTSPLAGAVVGHYLDTYFRTDPLLTIIMLVAGFIAGTVYLIQILKEPESSS